MRRADERTGGVVDEHDVGGGRHCGERAGHRIAPPFAALGHGSHHTASRPETRRRRVEVRRRQRDDHFVDTRVAGQRRQAPLEQRAAAQGAELLRRTAAGRVPRPPAARIALTDGRRRHATHRPLSSSADRRRSNAGGRAVEHPLHLDRGTDAGA